MLWLALHFPDLALQVFAQRPDQAFAVSTPGRRTEILAANPGARALGVAAGMSVSAACALAPGLAVQPHNAHREAETLAGIAAWALQFTPEVSPAPPDAMLMEIGGCLKLFGGLDRLLAQVRQGLLEMGLDALAAAAPTPAGAHALARAGLELQVPDLPALGRHLAALPLACLASPQSAMAVDALAAMGVKTVADCLRLPRDGLARRFGPDLPAVLDRALGRQADPRPLFALPEQFAARLEFAAPVPEVASLLFGVKRLVTELCGWLMARNAGVRRLTLSLSHERRPPSRVELTLAAPQHDAGHLLALLRERLDRLSLTADVAGLALAADETAQLTPLNFSLFGDRARIREDCLNLVERLQARLGMDAVSGLALCPEHRPELAWREVPPGSATPDAVFPPRPAWLLERPRPLPSRDAMPWLDGPLSLMAGPERIESGWWDEQPVRRDYYLAQAASGARLWVYREHEGQARWFLHGLFA